MTRRLPFTTIGTGALVALGVCGVVSLSARTGSPAPEAARPPTTSRTPRPPRFDNLVALEMGGRVENQPSRPGTLAIVPERALDGDAKTMWLELFPPATIVLSFIGRDAALVASVSITSPNADSPPPYGVNLTAARPRAVEISLSTTSPTTGFVKAISAPLPDDDSEHVVKLPVPTEARFIKLTFPPPAAASYGKNGIAIGEIVVREGARAGYTPLLDRHADLRALLSSGTLEPDPASLAYQAPGSAEGVSCLAPSIAAAECPESKSVLLIATAPENYYPLNAAAGRLSPPAALRYFGPGPGQGLVDESIYKRVNYWLLQPDLVRPADLVPSAHVDTVVLEQVCDIKASVRTDVKQALVAWVANGNKLIISDSDSCGSGNVPDYSFLPYPFATSNPGGRASASALQIVEQNFLVSPDSHAPAFFDEPSWRLKKNGNISNDFGDSNTVIKYDDHWCGALFGSNAIGGSGFVMAYAHYGRGVIIYDGIDRDQRANIAYHQYVSRQLLLPFRPDPLPCSLRVAPFAITTDVALVERQVNAGETVTYPLTVLAAKPDYAGTVALSVAAPAAPGFAGHIDPATVTLGAKGAATLTLTAPAAITKPIPFAVRGTAAGASGTLCLTIDAPRNGHLTVTPDLGPAPSAKSRKHLLIILDLSGSMNEALGKSTRIATARTVLHNVLSGVPDDFDVGLRVYGDRYGSKQKETCTDSHLVQPVQKIDRSALLKLIDAAKPRGETPLVYSVLQAIADLKSAGGGSVVLITDGEESCGGDFSAAAAAIRQSGLDFRLNIVGFTLRGPEAQKALGSLATATGGAYYGAQDGTALAHALAAATVTSFPFSIEDATGKVVAQGEAGDAGHNLPPGDYTVVVQAGDQVLSLAHVTVAVGRQSNVRVTRTNSGFAIAR